MVERVVPNPKPLALVRTTLEDVEPVLRRLAHRWCKHTSDAHDLLQDTFERALRQGISPEVRCVGAWLATIMQNLFINRCRAAARQPVHEPLEDNDARVIRFDPDSTEPAWSNITLHDVREALAQVEPVYADVYRMHTFERLSYEQIAQKLSIQRITVGTRLSRARRRLREILVKRFGLEGQP